MTQRRSATMRACLSGLLTAAMLLATGELRAAQGADEPRLDRDRLGKTVEANTARLNEKGARWTASINVKQTVEVRVDVVQFAGRRRYTVEFQRDGANLPILQLIDRDGSWYVHEKDGTFGRYRPYEAPFSVPSLYIFLEQAELLFAPADLSSLGTLESVADGVAHFRQPISDESRKLIESMLEQFEAMEEADMPSSDRLVATKQALRDLLKLGVPHEVHLATGILTSYGTPDMQTRVEHFQWLDSAPKDAFALDAEYPDHASDPTTGDLNALVMICHSGIWQPAMGSAGDAGIRLLNIRTGDLRRVPFRGRTAVPGCFLKDRKHVVVSGMVTGQTGMGLYEIDLSTGENRKLGGKALGNTFCFDPCVSPDGKLIAVKVLGTPNPTLPSHIYVIDVESGRTRKIGEVVGGMHLAWMPDGKRILMQREEFVAWDKPADGTVCTMALDGTVKDVVEGEWPVLIAGNRIMFESRGERVWHTCDLDGGDVKVLADGLGHYGFPTVSPSGKYVLMMRFGGPRGPRPTLFKIGESQGREIVKLGGLWSFPTWQ